MKPVVLLILSCAFGLVLALPTLNDNIGDPNRIVYFNADEGGLMDEAWYYYSGEKRPSFQWDEDYGLEMVYVSGITRSLLSHIMDITPGRLVLILRSFHLAAWILALVSLWFFVGRHFGKGWFQGAAVALLAVRPAFAYFINNMKPEPLVLLMVIWGLDYTLRMLDNPSRMNFLIAVAFASMAFIVKFEGFFLLPSIIAAFYLTRSGAKRINDGQVFPAVIGVLVMLFTSLMLMFYVRKATGMTWCGEYGYFGALTKSGVGIKLFISGTALILLSFVLLIMNGSPVPSVKRLAGRIAAVNSSSMTVFGAFLAFTAIFGFKWLLDPMHFILTYAPLGAASAGSRFIAEIGDKGILLSFAGNLISKINAMDAIIFLLFVVYLFKEFYGRGKDEAVGKEFKKRMVLAVFLAPAFILILSMLKFEYYHMLPYFTVMSILALCGVSMTYKGMKPGTAQGTAFTILIVVILAVDILVNGAITGKLRAGEFRKGCDISYDAERWLKENVSPDTVIAAGHYIKVYIPPEYVNAKTFGGYGSDGIKELRDIVRIYRPRIIYYNAGPSGADPLPPIEEMLPDVKVRMLKEFDSSGRAYRRAEGDRFLVYEVVR